MFERPTLLGNRYRLRESIGRGGMGQVWLARDETLGRDVAIKQITPPPDKPNSRLDTLSRMALHEAQAAAQLTGPHTVHVYDIVQFEAIPWIVMEHVPSRSLHDIITQTGPLPPAYVATIGLAILDALLAAHRAGVLHRDVTPRNVLIGSGGRIVLCDFGLASWNASGDSPDREVRGTAGYVAPERALAGTSSAEGDFWSLGATLYAAVEGHSPYERPSAIETLSALVTSPPDPPQLAGPLEDTLRGLLRREPRSRMRPEELHRRLKQVASGQIKPSRRLRHRVGRLAPSHDAELATCRI